MPRRLRLDAELVRRSLARSREQASELIREGRVRVDGRTATKPATQITTGQAVQVLPDTSGIPQYVGRGAHKLFGALAAFAPVGLSVAGRRCLDAGASTGGFTDVLLRAGATQVVAVDVGYGQLAWSLRSDDRVQVHDRTNVRELTPQLIDGSVDVVVGDLSFISLTLVLDALVGVTALDGDLVLMVKPQFEVGRERIAKGGVVRDLAARADAIEQVAQRGLALGWGAQAVAVSPLPGPTGNVEFFLWFRLGPARVGTEEFQAVAAVEPEGPGATAGVPDERLRP